MSLAGVGAEVLFVDELFSPATAHGFSLGLLLTGALAAIIAVYQRWPWYFRIAVYGAWIATFAGIGGIGGFLIPAETPRMIACLVGSVVVLLLTGVAAYRTHAKSR